MSNDLKGLLGSAIDDLRVGDVLGALASAVRQDTESSKGPRVRADRDRAEELNPEYKKFRESDLPRRFLSYRKHDHSGVSGTGYVAAGVEFPDGTVVLHWFGNKASTSVFPSMGVLRDVHGHEGSTQFEFID